MQTYSSMKQPHTAMFLGEERGFLPLAMKAALIIEKQTHGTSINDKLDKGKGTGMIKLQAVHTERKSSMIK